MERAGNRRVVVLRAEGGIENLPSLSLDPGLSGQGYRLVQSADGKEVP